MKKYVYIVMSGNIDDMELNNFEGVFKTETKAEEYVEHCEATIVKDNDNYYYNSCEVHEIKKEEVQ